MSCPEAIRRQKEIARKESAVDAADLVEKLVAAAREAPDEQLRNYDRPIQIISHGRLPRPEPEHRTGLQMDTYLRLRFREKTRIKNNPGVDSSSNAKKQGI